MSAVDFSSYPTQLLSVILEDDATVVTLNHGIIYQTASLPACHTPSLAAVACHLFGAPAYKILNAITIATQETIADTGATLIFIMEGVDLDNKYVATKLLRINLPDGHNMGMTHVCNCIIPGFPTPLVRHIILHLAVALLIGIHPLCKAGCKVLFYYHKCDVMYYNGKSILHGFKDPSTDLWTLPINTKKMWSSLQQLAIVLDCTPHQTKGDAVHSLHPAVNLATFTHSMRTCENGIKFTHHSLCNPKLSTLIKAVRKWFLKGCPNLSKKLILNYFNQSPATAKGHMKHPRHCIQSTQKINQDAPTTTIIPLPDLSNQLNPKPPVFMQIRIECGFQDIGCYLTSLPTMATNKLQTFLPWCICRQNFRHRVQQPHGELPLYVV